MDERTRHLIEAITSTIEPESWREAGGKGTISVFKGKLVVRNSEEVHQAIAALLGEDSLRRRD